MSHSFLGKGSCVATVFEDDSVLSVEDFDGEGTLSFESFFKVVFWSLEDLFSASPDTSVADFFFIFCSSISVSFLRETFLSSRSSSAMPSEGGGIKSCLFINDRITVGSELDRDRWYEIDTARLQKMLNRIS